MKNLPNLSLSLSLDEELAKSICLSAAHFSIIPVAECLEWTFKELQHAEDQNKAWK